jgi:cytochrome c oxidase cbb3-type subunit III
MKTAKNGEIRGSRRRARRGSVKPWLPAAAVLLAAIPVYTQNNPPGAASQNPFAGNGQAAAEGGEIFNRVCTACHGYEGAEGERAPALAANARRYQRNTDPQLFDAIEHGIPGTQMPPSGLSESDAWKVTAYIHGLRSFAIDMPVAGDVAHGEDIFWNKGGCGACHMMHGRGGLMGPDLSNVAVRRKVNSIRDALTKAQYKITTDGGSHDAALAPSSRYQQVRVVTRDGKTISGVLRNEDSFSLQILGSDGALHLFQRNDLRDISYESKSLMPSDYDKRLTPGEFQDLMAFLTRQGSKPIPPAGRGGKKKGAPADN